MTPNSTNHPPVLRPIRLACVLVASAPLSLFAQVTAQQPAAGDEHSINLSRFEVTTTQDKGYIANNAATGFKTNQSLMKIPQSVTVITRDLIDDIGATRTSDVLQFAGASQFYRGESVRLRGARTLNPYIDDAIDNIPYSDNVNIDSYEIIRGPAGVLYANASVGGVVLKATKKPLPTSRNQINFSVKDWGQYRAELDSTGPLTQVGDARLSYRFVGAFQGGDAYFKNFEDDRIAIHPTLQVDLGNTTARFAIDYIDMTTGAASQNFVLPDGKLYTGAGRDESYYAPGVMEDHEQFRQRLAVLHRFSPNWESKLSITHVDYERRGSILLPNNLDLATQRLGLRARRNFQRFDNWIINQDFLGNYHLGSLENQSALGFTLTDEITRSAFTNSTTFGVQQVPIANPQMNTIVVQPYNSYPAVSTTGSWGKNRRSTYYYQHQLTAIPERLILVGGFTYAALQTDDVPAVESRHTAGGTRVVSYEEWLHRIGAVFNITQDIALFVLESTTFAPQANSNTRDVNGALLPAQNGKGQEIGLKTSFFEGKLSATVSYFDMSLTNVGVLQGVQSPVTGQNYFSPVGKQTQKGWDATIAYAPIPQWQVLVSLYDGTVKDQNGAILNNTYTDLVSFFTRYDFTQGTLKGFSIGGGASRTGGNIFTALGTYTFPTGVTPGPITLEAVWNANMFVSYRYNKNWTFRLGVENVLDKAFAVGAQTPLIVDPSPPRTFQLSSSYRF